MIDLQKPAFKDMLEVVRGGPSIRVRPKGESWMGKKTIPETRPNSSSEWWTPRDRTTYPVAGKKLGPSSRGFSCAFMWIGTQK